MTRLKNKGAFSLVELVVSLGIMGLVLTAAAFVYNWGVMEWERGGRRMELQQNLRIAMDTLSTDIRKADVIYVYGDGSRLVLMGKDSWIKTYYYSRAAKEIRLGESGSAVAMHIEACEFRLEGNMLVLLIDAGAVEGKRGETHRFRVGTRGKMVYEY